jgi:hypothetical protein
MVTPLADGVWWVELVSGYLRRSKDHLNLSAETRFITPCTQLTSKQSGYVLRSNGYTPG